jgi:hypothetical protein
MTLVEQISADAKILPYQYRFYGPLSSSLLTHLIEKNKWRIPVDLFELWTVYGGLDFLLSETIMGPIAHQSWQDEVYGCNEILRDTGKDKDLLLFHCGRGNSMIDQKTLYVKVFGRHDYGFGEYKTYPNCLEWYIHEPRADAVALGRLPPAQNNKAKS